MLDTFFYTSVTQTVVSLEAQRLQVNTRRVNDYVFLLDTNIIPPTL